MNTVVSTVNNFYAQYIQMNISDMAKHTRQLPLSKIKSKLFSGVFKITLVNVLLIITFVAFSA